MAGAMTGTNEVVVGHVEARVHGRYLLRSAPSRAPLLIGFHGYGEGADSILQALLGVSATRRWHVASIQGLHRFYNRRSGGVVASWMTKQDRELSITDNLAYVEGTLAALGERVEVSGPTVFAGFSQGTAMAYRAAAAVGGACQGIVALAGDVPPEMAEVESWNRPAVLIGRGTADAWYNEAMWQRDELVLEGLGSTVETCVFEGGHEWTDTFRRAVAAFLQRLSG
jgi:predicted esterase